MRYTAKKFVQVFIGLAAVLGLFASSISACGCSHHRESPEPSGSCHSVDGGHRHSEKGKKVAIPSIDESCVCIPQASKLSVKSESFKLKKHPGLFSVSLQFKQPQLFATDVSTLSILASSPYRLQFSRAASSRGPPAA